MLNRLCTENNDASKLTLVDLQRLFQDQDFKHHIFDYIRARGSVRVKSALRLLNKQLNNSMQSSITEVHIGYQHLKKLSESNFKDTLNKIKVTINNQNRKYTKNNEQVYCCLQTGISIKTDELKLLSPKVFKNVKVAEVVIDESIDNLGWSDHYMCLTVPLDESLCLRGLRVVNKSQFSTCIEIYGKNGKDITLEISNSQFEGIVLSSGSCKLHVHDINFINSGRFGGIIADKCTQSIIEGISIEGVADGGVYADKCDAIQLRNISIKNCSQIDDRAVTIKKCQNFDIQNFSIRQSKIQLEFVESTGCIQDSIIETIAHGIIMKNSQISHRNVAICCDDDGNIFKMDEESRWIRLW